MNTDTLAFLLFLVVVLLAAARVAIVLLCRWMMAKVREETKWVDDL